MQDVTVARLYSLQSTDSPLLHLLNLNMSSIKNLKNFDQSQQNSPVCVPLSRRKYGRCLNVQGSFPSDIVE
jgi:hypothetical protein